MAFIRLDPNSLALDVLVGIEESYKPTKEIKKFSKSVLALRADIHEYLQKTFETQNAQEVNVILNKDKDKKEGWEKFLFI